MGSMQIVLGPTIARRQAKVAEIRHPKTLYNGE
jgi:hypothetical protein